jgi:hypothetical protein
MPELPLAGPQARVLPDASRRTHRPVIEFCFSIFLTLFVTKKLIYVN